MPRLDVVSRSEAELNTAVKTRAMELRQCMGFVEALKGDQAGRLEASAGEAPRTEKRRLAMRGS